MASESREGLVYSGKGATNSWFGSWMFVEPEGKTG